MAATPAITSETFGAWLLKADPSVDGFDEHARSGFREVTTRCLRPSYRTALISAGQPVLLWVSGRHPVHPPGLHAAGHTTGPVGASADGPVMPVRMSPLTPVVPRTELLADPVLSALEVLRMPAGSNPSYLDREQYAALRAAFPQVDRPEQSQDRTA